MESKGFEHLDRVVRLLMSRKGQSAIRSAQLSSALAKSREEIERLKATTHRLKTEKSETRKQIDAVIRQIDQLSESSRLAPTAGQSHEERD